MEYDYQIGSAKRMQLVILICVSVEPEFLFGHDISESVHVR
jgi:hypothetical protein